MFFFFGGGHAMLRNTHFCYSSYSICRIEMKAASTKNEMAINHIEWMGPYVYRLCHLCFLLLHFCSATGSLYVTLWPNVFSVSETKSPKKASRFKSLSNDTPDTSLSWTQSWPRLHLRRSTSFFGQSDETCHEKSSCADWNWRRREVFRQFFSVTKTA